MKEGRDRGFNSPKSKQVVEFVKNSVGIDDISSSWVVGDLDSKACAKKLDALIVVRGEIAHRGRIKEALDQSYISDHVIFLRGMVAKTGGRINQHLKKITKKGLW